MKTPLEKVPGLEIRRITKDDVALFERIAEEVYDEEVRPERLIAYLEQPVNRLLLAIDTQDLDSKGRPLVVGQCAAVLHHHPDKPTELYVDELGTAADYRRRGIGRKLMEVMFDWGRELGCEESWLGTEIDNLAARALYEMLPEVESSSAVIFEYDLEDE